MNPKNEPSRITIDIPTRNHKRLKTIAAVQGKSMCEIVGELIEQYVSSKPFPDCKECVESDHVPNKETRRAIERAY